MRERPQLEASPAPAGPQLPHSKGRRRGEEGRGVKPVKLWKQRAHARARAPSWFATPARDLDPCASPRDDPFTVGLVGALASSFALTARPACLPACLSRTPPPHDSGGESEGPTFFWLLFIAGTAYQDARRIQFGQDPSRATCKLDHEL